MHIINLSWPWCSLSHFLWMRQKTDLKTNFLCELTHSNRRHWTWHLSIRPLPTSFCRSWCGSGANPSWHWRHTKTNNPSQSHLQAEAPINLTPICMCLDWGGGGGGGGTWETPAGNQVPTQNLHFSLDIGDQCFLCHAEHSMVKKRFEIRTMPEQSCVFLWLNVS